jgi:heterodisulfide reductase subunit A
MNKTAAVIGGGISGMQAALSLADRGIKVYLIERSSSIGGIMTRLDKTMPTMDCSICILSPFMLAVARNPLIEVMTLAEVVGDERTAGGHTLTVRKHPRYVDLEKCTGCRECMAKCPKKVTLPYEGAYGTQKAIHFDFDQAIPAAPYIDASVCLKLTKGICGNCAKFCDKDAIDFDQVEEEATLSVGGVVIATGAEPYLPTDRPEYGYGVYKNVITAMELERLLSAAGPTGGTVLRASDKKEPKRVASSTASGPVTTRPAKGTAPRCAACTASRRHCLSRTMTRRPMSPSFTSISVPAAKGTRNSTRTRARPSDLSADVPGRCSNATTGTFLSAMRTPKPKR